MAGVRTWKPGQTDNGQAPPEKEGVRSDTAVRRARSPSNTLAHCLEGELPSGFHQRTGTPPGTSARASPRHTRRHRGPEASRMAPSSPGSTVNI